MTRWRWTYDGYREMVYRTELAPLAAFRYLWGEREHYSLPDEEPINLRAACLALAACCVLVAALILWGSAASLWVERMVTP